MKLLLAMLIISSMVMAEPIEFTYPLNPGNYSYTSDYTATYAWRDDGAFGASLHPKSGDTVTVLKEIAIVAKEQGAGSKTIDVALVKWDGTNSEWDTENEYTLTIDGSGYTTYATPELYDTLEAGAYYRLSVSGGSGATVYIRRGTCLEVCAYIYDGQVPLSASWTYSEDEDVTSDRPNMLATLTWEDTSYVAPMRRRDQLYGGGE